MNWFEYGAPKRRSLRKGVWLNISFLPKDLLEKAQAHIHKGEEIERVSIDEIQDDNKVLLEFWCRKPNEKLLDNVWRYNVFHLQVAENPKWICDGNIERGFKEN